MIDQYFIPAIGDVLQTDGTLEIVMDGIINRVMSPRMAALAAFLLLLLEDVYKVRRLDGNLQEFQRAPTVTSRIKQISIIDGSFMRRDGMFLKNFLENYVFAVQGITNTHVSVNRSEAHPLLFQRYFYPETYTSIEDRVVMKPYTFMINKSIEPRDLTDWGVPYYKSTFHFLFAKYFKSKDPSVIDKLNAIIGLNFLRDAHRIDIAARKRALFLTADRTSYRYYAWIQKNHPNLRHPGWLLNFNIPDKRVQKFSISVAKL
jgi:hypothetical protein